MQITEIFIRWQMQIKILISYLKKNNKTNLWTFLCIVRMFMMLNSKKKLARQIFYSINESCLSFDVLAGPCGGKWVALCRIAWILESYQHKIQWRLLRWGNVTLLHFRMSSAVWHQRQRIRTVRLNSESNKISIQFKKTINISLSLLWKIEQI